ncbi:MAG: M48 family metallopeptidase [Burkholderiales bacterium]|nr:M48 family metallopeptidase [Burkholderiales bacterium]
MIEARIETRIQAPIEARYYDGRSARARPVRLRIEAGELVAAIQEGEGAEHGGSGADAAADPAATLRWNLAQVHWPERTRHGQRIVHLAGGGQLDIVDAAAFDAWRAAQGVRESWVVRAQQHWRGTLGALVLLVAVIAAGYRWGVPWAADMLVAVVPVHVDRAVGEAAYENLRSRWLEPSKLPPARQQALRELCGAALDATQARAAQRPWLLRFHAGGKALGANAFALPDGSIVITDEMVALLEGHDDTLVGVFGHEYGHVHLRHGMRALARFALVSTATSVALGDFSTVLAGVPAVLAQLGYSRDAEREADEQAARLLAASGRSPQVMVVLFERLAQRGAGQGERRERPEGRERRAGDESPGSTLPIALASHPFDEERVRFFRDYRR